MENEKRLIDANRLAPIIEGEIIDGRAKAINETLRTVLDLIRAFPTVDAVEVVHAQWLYDSGSGCYFCSACDEFAIEQLHGDSDGTEYYEGYLTRYCPNCGAKMDGDGNA